MLKLVSFLLLTPSFAIPLSAQSVAGIEVGDPPTLLDKLNLKAVAHVTQGSTDSTKYVLPNGDELSVTSDSQAKKIVYVEHDWSRGSANTPADFPGFTFGVTTLEEIRKVTHSNGFTYRRNAMGAAAGEFFTFNAYTLANKPDLVVVFVTAFNVSEVRNALGGRNPSRDEMARYLKLDGLILAREDYLDQLWGVEKVSDPENKPIAWAAVQPTAKASHWQRRAESDANLKWSSSGVVSRSPSS